MKTLKELKAQFGALQTEREGLKAKRDDGTALTEAENKRYIEIIDAQTALLDDIKQAEKEVAVDAAARQPAASIGSVAVMGPAAEEAPYSFGEYLQDIFKATTGRERTQRFESLQRKFKAAATGLNESVPSDGGFLVGTDMMQELMVNTYARAPLAGRCSRAPISGNANAMTINGISETSRVNGSRSGGILGYWEGEADSIRPTKPKFAQVNLKLSKVTAAYYATDEVLQDAPFMQAQVNSLVADELSFKLDDALISGTGAGQPLGFLKAPALISVAKETGQTKDTIKWENVKKMYAAMPARNKPGAVWVANDETLPELMGMYMPVGTAGVAVWMPANAAVGLPNDTLLGKPVIYAEQASALGDVGDLSLVDFSQIQLIDKGGIQGASSIHVAFLASEQVFRFVYRVDAQPLWKSALTPYKGSATQSPFVTIAARD